MCFMCLKICCYKSYPLIVQTLSHDWNLLKCRMTDKMALLIKYLKKLFTENSNHLSHISFSIKFKYNLTIRTKCIDLIYFNV